ncbi:hypothetical protein HYV58_02040 [Candidatus Peregrinibacteria bacterium]|nr:hypothetical protein [Candidatus Peregrinibacteria bacterium]
MKKAKTYALLAIIVGGTVGFTLAGKFFSDNYEIKIQRKASAVAAAKSVIKFEKKLKLPSVWKSVNKSLFEEGVIDKTAFDNMYEQRGGMSQKMKDMLSPDSSGGVFITEENSALALNLLWALGLGNKNVILDEGPMVSKEYGGDASGFASTGGWSLAHGNPMDHYSKHAFISLSSEQQELVERVAKNIYRPCCNNSTYFPDCNHGMAMLGFLQLMAAEGAKEQELYDAALTLNAFWFPDTYETINAYLAAKGISKKDVSSQMLLGKAFSSSSGYRTVLSQVSQPSSNSRSGGCSV